MYPNHMTRELSGRTCCVCIETIETFLKKLEKTLKEHLKTTIHSSHQILTGRKTAHDFDEMFQLQCYEKGIRLCTLCTSRAAANLRISV